jgi:FkbM family methyltransferase
MFFPNRITKIQPGDRVLEIGPGGLPHPRSDVFLELALDEDSLVAQRGNADALVTNKQVVYYDGGKFPFKDNEFDYVICSHVLEHVPRLDAFVAEMFRVARAGYVEYPTAYYEYLYNYDVHLNLLAKHGDTIRYMPKSKLPFKAFAPVQDFMRQTQSQGYFSFVDQLVDYMGEGFEWDRPFKVSEAKQLSDMLPERPAVTPYVPTRRRPLLRRALGKLRRSLVSPISRQILGDRTETSSTIDAYLDTPATQETILTKLFPRDATLTIFDIGACEGEDSIRYKRLFPDAKIYTFEPLPDNMSKIRANLDKYNMTGITPIQIALSDSEGVAVFHVSSGTPEHVDSSEGWDYGNKSSSLLPPDKTLEVHPWLHFDETIEVQTDTLASFVVERGIDTIDFIHMDVQGAELMVLSGAGSFIKNVRAIWLEVENVELYKDQPTKSGIEKYMAENGFVCIKSTVDTVAGDQFYANKNSFAPGLLSKILINDRARSVRDNTNRLAKRIARKGVRTVMGDTSRVHLKGGKRMFVNRGMAWAFSDGAYYERNVEHWLRLSAQRLGNPVVFDIGANAGYYSLILSPLASSVYAFEPGRSTRRQLHVNMLINRTANVHVVGYGLGSTSEQAEFNVYSSNGNNSLYERNIPEGHELKLLRKEQVRIRPLDLLMSQMRIPAPDLIKIDVEGGELEALRGALGTIRSAKPVMLFEYSEATSHDAGYKRLDLLKLLAPLDYEFYGLAEEPTDLHLYPMNTSSGLSTSGKAIDNILAIPRTRRDHFLKVLDTAGDSR